jgi:hypothetical protein
VVRLTGTLKCSEDDYETESLSDLSEHRARMHSKARVERARPVVYVSTSEGLITDWLAFDGATGRVLTDGELPVIVVQIDWDEVHRADEPDTNDEVAYVRSVIKDERIPQSVRDDIAISLEDASRGWPDKENE